MIWAQLPEKDGEIHSSAIPLGLMLFDIWIHVSVLANLMQEVIDTSVVYLVVCHMLND